MVLGIDHIAISAGRLQEGVEYVEAALGVPLEAGGRHLRFGTHNQKYQSDTVVSELCLD